MKRVDLTKEYREEIEGWDWEQVIAECKADEYATEPEYEGDSKIGRTFLGTVFAIMPSGKYYMPWCTNQTWRDVVKDTLFQKILNEIAEKHGCWIESGEDDLCDLFVATVID